MNTTVAFAAQATAILMGFFTRVIFTRMLSEGYVGINGLFHDILNILSLSELGVGTAITYALYGPIAKKDIRRQQILMRMFRTFYRATAGFVLVVGLALLPFLNVLMKDRPDVDHLTLIYLLYLFKSVASYLLIYKKTLVDAHQLNYITVLYHNGFLVLQDVCQIVILLLTGNFILFLVIGVVCTIAGNICMSKKVDQLFPYLKEECKEKLPDTERKDILKNVKAMFMHKLGNVVVNNTDNLLISSFVGVVSAGIYSNYYLLIGSVRQVLDQALQGVAASVGNLGVTEDKEKISDVFEQLFFVGYWMYGLAGICLFELLNPFVELAFGEKYLFQRKIVLILCINFFINGMRKSVLIFKESMGLFWYDRYKANLGEAVNLGISIVLVKILVFWGVFCRNLLQVQCSLPCGWSLFIFSINIVFYRPVKEYFKTYGVSADDGSCLGASQKEAASLSEEGFWHSFSFGACLPGSTEPVALADFPADRKMERLSGLLKRIGKKVKKSLRR